MGWTESNFRMLIASQGRRFRKAISWLHPIICSWQSRDDVISWLEKTYIAQEWCETDEKLLQTASSISRRPFRTTHLLSARYHLSLAIYNTHIVCVNLVITGNILTQLIYHSLAVRAMLCICETRPMSRRKNSKNNRQKKLSYFI